MAEFEPYRLGELFKGNWDLFKEAVNSPNVVFVYDADGIIIDSPASVLLEFALKNRVRTDKQEIDRWNYLTYIAQTAGLDETVIKSAEDGWYKSEVLLEAPRYLYIRPVIDETISIAGIDKNFVLTSREPHLKESTLASLRIHAPEIPEKNILIRSVDEANVKPTDFKVNCIKKLAEKASWIVFIEDSTKYIKSVLDSGPENCLAINVPLGKIRPDFAHERLIVVERFPKRHQGMYVLLDMLSKARQDA